MQKTKKRTITRKKKNKREENNRNKIWNLSIKARALLNFQIAVNKISLNISNRVML